MSPRILMILVGCGAAAGIAGIFKAPIAGLLFTLEVLMLDLTAVSVMPLLIASITSTTLAYVYTGYEFEFFFAQTEDFYTSRIPYVIMLGIVCGFASLYFTRAMNMMENFFRRFKNPWVKTAIGCVILSALVFFFPPLYGEGYGSITGLLAGDTSSIVDGSIFYSDRHEFWFLALFIGLVVMSKAFATSATNGGGGVGGTFRAVTLCRLPHGLPLCLHTQPLRVDRAVDQELCPNRYGRGDERRNARATDGNLPYRRTYRRLRPLSAVADSQHYIHTAPSRFSSHTRFTPCVLPSAANCSRTAKTRPYLPC